MDNIKRYQEFTNSINKLEKELYLLRDKKEKTEEEISEKEKDLFEKFPNCKTIEEVTTELAAVEEKLKLKKEKIEEEISNFLEEVEKNA